MVLRLAILALGAAYVGYRLGLSVMTARAVRRGDTAREAALRRRAFYARWGAVGVVAGAGLLLFGLVALNNR